MLDPTLTLVIGLTISTAIGLAIYLFEKKRGFNQERAAGVLCGLMGVIISGLLAHEAQVQQALSDAVPQIKSQALRLIVSDIESLDKELEVWVAENRAHDLIFEPVRQALSRRMADARAGRVVLESKAGTINLAAALVASAKSRVWATSYINPTEWWSTSAGDEYEEAGVPEIVNVDFQRVFICESQAEVDKLAEVMQRQADSGVLVRYVMASDLDLNLRRDILVIDDGVSAEIVLNQGRRFREGHFFLSRTMAEDLAESFRKIRISGIEVLKAN